MKIEHFILLVVSIATSFLATGCIVIDLNGCGRETVKGSGKLVSEEREVSSFNQIVLKGTGKVTLTQGDRQYVKIRTDDNVMSLIDTTVKNEKLEISHNGWNLRPTALEYFITVSDLKGVSVKGSGDITGKDRFLCGDFYADVSGSGDISMELEAVQLDSDISGSGSIQLAGKSNSHNASITGSGKIIAYDMETKTASVKITGSGDCKVNVSEKLQANITGSGDLRYKGHPQIRTKITGSGSVENLN